MAVMEIINPEINAKALNLADRADYWRQAENKEEETRALFMLLSAAREFTEAVERAGELSDIF